MLAQHSQELNALHNSSKRSQDTNAETTGDESNSGKTTEPSESNVPADTAVSKIPGLKVKSFGSWEPEEFDGPFGKGTKIIGPVGYYISWNSNSDSEEEGSEKEEATTSNEEAEKTETVTQ